MSQRTDYDTATLNAYRSARRAAEYRRHQTTEWSWARFVTWREQRALARELRRYPWTATDQLLDIPCGTGILGRLLQRFPFRIVASDISPEMMALARPEYPQDRLIDCVQADITRTPFPRGAFACVVTLGFLHRVPLEIKRAALREMAALSAKVVVATCSVDTPLQRMKKRLLSVLRPGHASAPCPISLVDLIAECEALGLRVVRAFMVVPLLSAEAVLVLEKRAAA